MEMQAGSYLEGGVISLPIGDKEQGKVKLARLMAEKETRDRAQAIQEERERAMNLALDRKNKRAEAAERSRQKNQEKMRKGRGKSGSPTRNPAGSSVSPSRESKQDNIKSISSNAVSEEKGNSVADDEEDEDAMRTKENKFFADEEQIRNMSLNPSYLPYYASFENEIIGKYGGSHPGGDLCMEPVKSIEDATKVYLRKYFLGMVPIINDAECSPKKLMSRITRATQILVMGEEERAWRNAITGIHNHLRGLTPAEAAAEAAGEEIEEDNEAKMKAVMSFLRKQMTLKNGEIELLEREMEMAQKNMQQKMDEMHALREKYSVF